MAVTCGPSGIGWARVDLASSPDSNAGGWKKRAWYPYASEI